MSRLLMAMLVCLCGTSLAAAETPTCTGKFLNPLTDICWSCLFPISLGGAPLATLGQQGCGTGPRFAERFGGNSGLKLRIFYF